ncbi:MAG: Nramp family divalent metal transporter [Gemmatimonadetes bacterium]|nr:Nramp family divalent metal transporter [Gemmatimonadota bacterium]
MSDPTTARAPGAADDLSDLQLPDMRWRSLLWHFGPGIILMMTGIGTSHVVTAPTAGGRFEYALLWVIPVSYIFKYHGFEMAFRFTNATGRSLMEAYATAWKKWPLWYVLIVTLAQCALGQAGRLIAASAVVYYIFSEGLGFDWPLAVWGVILGSLSVAIILRGRYKAVEWAAKILAAILFVSTAAVYFIEPAPLSAMARFFMVETPAGSWLIIAAFLGLLPTGIDVSLQASEWGKAQRVGMGRIRERLEAGGHAPRFDAFAPRAADLAVDRGALPEHAREYTRRWWITGLWDFRIGHVISFLIACAFLLLAAVWLYPSPVEGRAVMGEIAGIFTRSIGPWMMVVFMLGAFAATFSTAFNYFDGWPRIVGACCRNLFRGTARLQGTARDELTPEHRRAWFSEYNIYRATMVYSLIASVAIIAGMPQPVYLVLIASALAFFIAPIIFYLNLHYCLKIIPKEDRDLYPGRFERAFAWLSLVIYTGMSVVLILAELFEIPVFGG